MGKVVVLSAPLVSNQTIMHCLGNFIKAIQTTTRRTCMLTSLKLFHCLVFVKYKYVNTFNFKTNHLGGESERLTFWLRPCLTVRQNIMCVMLLQILLKLS